MNEREQSLVYSIILILPVLWSFLMFSNFNQTLRLYIIVPLLLTSLLINYLLKRKNIFERSFQKAKNCFLYFAIYMVAVSFFANNVLFALKLALVFSTVFTFSFLGYNIKYFSYIGYVYALIAAVIILDYNRGGLTGGWNSNSIGLIVINGVYLLFLSIDLGNKQGVILKLSLASLLLILVANTDCRSIYIGFITFIIIRYLIFKLKSMNKSKYMIICTFLITIPFLVVQIYLYIYNLPNAEAIDKFVFDLTEKQLFSGREFVWDYILKNDLNGIKLWFGNGYSLWNTHSIYIDVLSDYGIIGTLLFATFLLSIIFTLYKHFNDPVIKTCVSCFFGMLILQSFETLSFSVTAQSYNNILYLFLALAVGRYISMEKREFSAKNRLYNTV